MIKAIKRVYHGVVFRLKYHHYQYMNRKKLVKKDFSIISNNCWGSFMYQKYGLKYLSPTCGLLILGHDYIRFCADLHHYLAQKLVFFPFEQSKYYELYKATSFPVAMCDDIEIYFMHYPTEKEAAEKWYRRAKRVNWDNIIYKISEREAFSEQDMMDFAALPLKNKIIIGEKKYTDDTIVIPGIHTYNGSEEDLVAQYFKEVDYFNSVANYSNC